MKCRPRLSQGLKTGYWFYRCCPMQPGKWQISEGSDEWRPSTWLLVRVGNEPNKESGGLNSPKHLGPRGVTLNGPSHRRLPRCWSLRPLCDHLRLGRLERYETSVQLRVRQKRWPIIVKDKQRKFAVLAGHFEERNIIYDVGGKSEDSFFEFWSFLEWQKILWLCAYFNVSLNFLQSSL